MRFATTVTATLAAAIAVAAPASADNEFGIPGGGDYPAPAPGVPAPAPAPVMHHVRYTVTTDEPFFAHIFYREVDPPSWSDYSHNPYQFSPRADTDLGPNQPWVFETNLADPNMWAMVVAQTGDGPEFPSPAFHCTLAVDGTVVVTNTGPRGALCSLRKW